MIPWERQTQYWWNRLMPQLPKYWDFKNAPAFPVSLQDSRVNNFLLGTLSLIATFSAFVFPCSHFSSISGFTCRKSWGLLVLRVSQCHSSLFLICFWNKQFHRWLWWHQHLEDKLHAITSHAPSVPSLECEDTQCKESSEVHRSALWRMLTLSRSQIWIIS